MPLYMVPVAVATETIAETITAGTATRAAQENPVHEFWIDQLADIGGCRVGSVGEGCCRVWPTDALEWGGGRMGTFRTITLVALFTSGAHAYDLLDYQANIQACINHDLEACYRISREQVPVTTYNLAHIRNKDAYDRDQTFNEALVMTQRFTTAMQQCRTGNINACEALLRDYVRTQAERDEVTTIIANLGKR